MTAAGEQGACAACLRRSWLLQELSPLLDYSCGAGERLIELLSLGDDRLLQAIGGRRRAELQARLANFDRRELSLVEGVEALCRHDPRYPRGLQGPRSPTMLHVSGGLERFGARAAQPVVVILGSRRPTDYGFQTAAALARELAASGVTVASELADGIALATQNGALEGHGATLTVLPGGLDVAAPAQRRALHEQLMREGSAVSELPCGARPRRWAVAAAQRILVGMAILTIVVEARDSPRELAGARLAQGLGKTVAAVPGRVTSPASSGTHALLLQGAHLIRGGADALDLIYGADRPAVDREPAGRTPEAPEPRLRATLERVRAGLDTPGKLIGERDDAGEVLLALSELELLGLLARGDGGRYIPRGARAD